ncbi:hypothetical protein F511_45580 [Dorcoceras hygrometricum]|uniref:Uncharacterized protein n=1 Tax=Dorcoceras hygrometricum TaxID=472368 RepID=A0A2Z6ZVM7_9LAMI|nr:hypothetical protein F511_45580 [Dorcoceras hygrometricum]
MHVGFDASLSRIHRSQTCVDILCYLRGTSRPLLSSLTPPPPPPCAAAAADRRRKIVSGQFDEENPFVLISSELLVQPDEGVSDVVVDRIGVNYRNLPRRAGLL